MAPLGGSQDVGVRADTQLVCVRNASGAYAPHISAFNPVLPGYFDLLELRVLTGRDFTWADRDARQIPAVVNDTFARTFLDGRSAVGEVVRTGLDCDRRFIDLVADCVRRPSPRSICRWATSPGLSR